MRQRLLKGNHLYAGAGGFRNLTFANIQRDVAYGRGAEGADPKRCDAQAGGEQQVAGAQVAFGDFAQSAAGNRALTLEGNSPDDEWSSAADVEGELRPTSKVQAVSRSRAKVSSPLRRRCAVIGTVLVKKALTSVQGPEVGVSLLSL